MGAEGVEFATVSSVWPTPRVKKSWDRKGRSEAERAAMHAIRRIEVVVGGCSGFFLLLLEGGSGKTRKQAKRTNSFTIRPCSSAKFSTLQSSKILELAHKYIFRRTNKPVCNA
jgi:hypothetical protein